MPADIEHSDPLRTREYAESYLNITQRHMRHLVADRRIRYTKVGKLLRFRQSWLDEFLRDAERGPVVIVRRRERAPTPEPASKPTPRKRRMRKAAA